MNRDELNKEIKDILGLVPTMFNTIPDDILEEEWNLFRKQNLLEGVIPIKFQQLMGLAVTSVTPSDNSIHFRTEIAKLFGATKEEIEATLNYTRQTVGLNVMINSQQQDVKDFRNEIQKLTKHVRTTMRTRKEKEELKYQ